MKKILVYILLLFTINSLGNNNAYKFNVKQINKTEYILLKRKYITIPFIKGKIIKKEGVVYLPTSKGGILALKDDLVNEEDPKMVEYKYIGEIGSLNQYVIEATYLNNSQIILVDKYNGHITNMLRFLSYSDRFIATFDMPQDDIYNGIILYKKNSNSLGRVLTIKEKAWYPEEITWCSRYSFVIKASTVRNRHIYFKISLFP